ncbi:PLP-dependent aspartate aminotransferase family protein [Fulvivirgaceae bacterium PWU4]|uniref:PLP-dependent aspartate aminotransferase family protein n=1 Tax=Chryseosolibacter histidini TaxID=2782349 RepID=A0AAP2GMT8_9BACT|nr:PLP-dependent aspartate aminotransferase family protein [Chryseosolibacter histidini]MBT1697283.1 PLP-dependent aspartate aminotransferase family protein [Chryseosolibacter histidini]
MSSSNGFSKLTQSVHAGSHGDPQYKGTTSPVFPSSAYDYEGTSVSLYPRYFNTPNNKFVTEKLAALENAEDGIVFSSGMAAILTSIFAMLKKGDHAIFQNDLYGGTHHAIVKEMPRYGIDHTFVDGADPANFEKAIRKETRVIYIETPSNPTLKITDIGAVAAIAKKHGLISIIDNTFASPVNQNPIDLGIDIVTHSGTKYIGGHSDICCGAALASRELITRIWESAIHFGGSLDAHTCWLVERSLKTMVLRVRQQNQNALALAQYLKSDSRIGKVYYPGLTDHPGHAIAKAQMPGGFGGMLSFEVKNDAARFMGNLKLIHRAISLGGVESTITSPAKTSHVKMSPAERLAIGVTDQLVRLSVGIEEADDLISDIKQALN